MQAFKLKSRKIIKCKYLLFASVLSVFLVLIYSKQDGLSKSSVFAGSFNSSLKSKEWPNVRILCYILLSRSKVKTAQLIKETWGSHCDEILFFGGYQYPDLPVTYLNISEGYENLWGKARAALLYLSGNSRFKEFEYFLKADDDTFVIVENLQKFVRNASLSLDVPVWFGYKLKHKRLPRGYMSGGAGYVFNYKALEKVTAILSPKPTSRISRNEEIINGICNTEGEYGIEDLELGKCFLAAGVETVNTRDEDGTERFLPLSYDVLLNGAISSFHWIWSQAWNRVRTGKQCCSQDLITMHEVSPSQMKLIYRLLYNTRVWKDKTVK